MMKKMPSITTAVPTNVYAVDLVKVSELVGCSEGELVRGMHSSAAVVDTEGVVVGNDAKVPFQKIERQDSFKKTAVKQVLLTAASRPSALDSFGVPKCLIQLGKSTIIEHILTQLYSAGMERVVISVSNCAEEIINTVSSHPIYHKMEIEFVELEDDNRGHARSILAVKDKFTDPFLLHTADHIFDSQLISDMSVFQLNQAAACVLVERDIPSTIDMTPTTVKVTLESDGLNVERIGRKVRKIDGIDAGLFLCTPRIFDTLETLAADESYFALADALSLFTSTRELVYLETQSKTWFSIETEEQLDFAKDHKGGPVLSPWTVYVARPPAAAERHISSMASSAPATLAPIHSRSIMFGVTAPETDTALHVLANDRIQQSKVFSGFVVGVGHVESSNALPDDDDMASDLEEQKALLRKRTQSEYSPHLQNTTEDPFVVAIPVTDQLKHGSVQALNSAHEAFLVEMPPDTTENNVFLAVAEMPQESPKLTMLERTLTLPTDVTAIRVETVGPEYEVHVVVDRQVPVVGFFLLATALITLSSVGAATDMQTDVNPSIKLFWRMSSTFLALVPLALSVTWRQGVPQLSKTDLGELFVCGFGYFVFGVTFIIALDMTSIGDAYLFSNCHSLIIVFGKGMMGIPILFMEGLGAVIGLIGGVICTFDKGDSSAPLSDPVYGDIIAFIGCFGGVVYLTLAKKLRKKLDLYVFMALLLAVSASCLFIYTVLAVPTVTFDLHPYTGLFGWLNLSSTRLPLELYIVFICNSLGQMGYVGVMKYFDPIVVSVVMLLEPIVASVLGVLIGVSPWPGLYTFIGGAAVLLGTLLVILSAKQKTESISVTQAVRNTSHTPKNARNNLSYGT